MKVVKELPISLFKSLQLLSIPKKRLVKPVKEKVPVIISLTSIPSRLNTLHLVVRSLLMQDVAAEKIVLWLKTDLKDTIPSALKKLISTRFEIRYSELNCSHRKLIHSLELFPNHVIVTCDDDLMYRKNWLSTIYKEHQKQPEKIIGNHTVHIQHDDTGQPIPFKKWKYPQSKKVNPWAITPIGAWGVLYPLPTPHINKCWMKTFLGNWLPKRTTYGLKPWHFYKALNPFKLRKRPRNPFPLSGHKK